MSYPLIASLERLREDRGALAALRASPPERGGAGISVGRALARVRDKSGSESIEGRFVALLDAHAEDIGHHLRYAIALLRSNEIPIDWDKLLSDVLAWDHEDRGVQRRWARNFWKDQPSEPDRNVASSDEGGAS